jgi:molybdate-binding protein/DNA-binding XRE family transcriptional regulator
MIVSYYDRIMADIVLGRNLVKVHRRQRGWSQAELAVRAAISRTAVSAIETNRLIPSVAAALSVAAAFGCSVETLFGPTAAEKAEPEWAWPPRQTPCRYWQARMQGRTLHFPVEATTASFVVHDGVFQRDTFLASGDADPAATLVTACCDPAASLLAAQYARVSGFRLIVLHRSSQQSLTLLGQGLVHTAGVHFATQEEPDRNVQMVRDTLGGGFRLLRVAGWQEGLTVAADSPVATVAAALRARLRWVGREPGSAARQCLDELLADRNPPRRIARDHRGVADAVRYGWADIGVCHRLVSEEATLRFFAVREEYFDLCYPETAESDPRIKVLLQVVRSSSYRRLLGELPGYTTSQAGEVQSVH